MATACWHLIHTDGPNKGQPYELDYGAPHFSTHEEAIRAAGRAHAAGQHLEPAQIPTPCATAVCTHCGDVYDAEDHRIEHHDTQDQADTAAMESGWTKDGRGRLLCLACTGH